VKNLKALIRPLAVMALPLFAAACSSTNNSSSDMLACTGVPPFTLASGTYTISNAIITVDTCAMGGPTVTSGDLNGTTRLVTVSGDMVTVSGSSTGSLNLGEGTVICDAGTLTLGMSSVTMGGGCTYDITRDSRVTVIANNDFELTFLENRSNVTVACNQAGNGTCNVGFDIELKM
jgi:hypothetical protein